MQSNYNSLYLAGHCWRSRDGLISNILLWTCSHGWAKAGWPAQTYVQQLCADTRCSPDDLPEAMDDREGWQERVKATSTELYVGSSWSFYFCSSMWRGLQEYVTYEFVPTSPAMSHMFGSSNLDSFRDGCCDQDLFNIAHSILL